MEEKLQQREKYGKIASVIGIIFNVVLAGAKIAVGSIFGALSILADGLNNLSDCGSSVMSLVSFKLANKPADEEHPFGHERIEYVLSMAVAFVILIIAFELLKESITKIINPEQMEFSYLIIGVLVGSIVIKIGLFIYNRAIARRLNSEILKATAIDCLSDSIATSVVLIGMIISKVFAISLDGYIGVIVALFIGFSGVNILKETMSYLVGKAPEREVIDSIKDRILAHEEVFGIHDLSVYCYGPNKYFASVHIEMDATVEVLESHEIVDRIEQEFLDNTNIVLTGHLDPIVVDDEEVNIMRRKVSECVKSIDERFSIHDFRMVKGPQKTNLIFDVAVPYNIKSTDMEIKAQLVEKIAMLGKYYNLVVKIEKQTL